VPDGRRLRARFESPRGLLPGPLSAPVRSPRREGRDGRPLRGTGVPVRDAGLRTAENHFRPGLPPGAVQRSTGEQPVTRNVPERRSSMRARSFGRSSGTLLGVLCLLASPAALAQMLDVDGLLVEASAVPTQGTVRVSGSGGGQTAAGDSEAVANVAGSV